MAKPKPDTGHETVPSGSPAEESWECLPDLVEMTPAELRTLIGSLRERLRRLEAANHQLHRQGARLAESHAHLQNLFESAPVGYLTLDHQQTIIDANDIAATLLGVERGSLTGRALAEFVPSGSRSQFEGHFRRDVAGSQKKIGQIDMRRGDGTSFTAHLQSVAESECDFDTLCWRTAFCDVTDELAAQQQLRALNDQLESRIAEQTARLRFANEYLLEELAEQKRLARALRDSEGKLQAVLEMAADAVITIDQTGVITGFNQAAETMFGYTAADALGKNIRMLMPPAYSDKHDDYLRRYLATQESRIIGGSRELVALRRNGTRFPIELSVSEIAHLQMFVGFIRDISERKELQAQLLRIAENEQRQIGQEIHDDVGQEMTALKLNVATLVEDLRAADCTAAEFADRIRRDIERTFRKLRALAQGLVPVHLDSRGLASALQELADAVSAGKPVSCRFLSGQPPFETDDDLLALQLYRIAQEAVNNAVKHAQAEAIEIELLQTPHGVDLRVRDDGVGFDEHAPRGLGLTLMQHRAGLIGGSLTVENQPEGGVCVTCTISHQL